MNGNANRPNVRFPRIPGPVVCFHPALFIAGHGSRCAWRAPRPRLSGGHNQLPSADERIFISCSLEAFCPSDLVDAVQAIHPIRGHRSPRNAVRPATGKALPSEPRGESLNKRITNG